MKKSRFNIMILLLLILCLWQAKPVHADIEIEESDETVFTKYDKQTKTLTVYGNGVFYVDWFASYSEVDLNKVIIEDGVTYIDGEFVDWRMKEVEIADSVTYVGSNAFEECSNLKSVKLPKGLKAIKEKTFYECNNLENVTFPDAITSIGDEAFGECISLKNITIPNTVTHIGKYAFSNTGITSLVIPDSVTSIGCGAFSECYSLKTVNIGKGLKTVPEACFESCKKLTSVTFGSGVKTIGLNSFGWCLSLKSVTVPKNVTKLDDFAFFCCYRLTKITIKNKKTTIKSTCFGYNAWWGSENASISNPDIVLYGYKDSTAQKFANKYKMGFQNIGEKQAAKPSITSLSSSKKDAQVQAKWKKVSKAYKYEVQIYEKPDEDNYRKYVRILVTKPSLKLKKLKDLKKGKTYYVRVRAFAKRSGKQIISPWSAVKKLKMKK